MAAEKKYTDRELEEAVSAYFASISKTEDVTVLVPTGERDQYGHEIRKPKIVVNDKGEPIRRLVYYVPPSIGALLLELGISRQTWSRYGKPGQGGKPTRKSRVVEEARLRVESYLAEQLLEAKNPRGAEFSLDRNFGWGKPAGKDREEPEMEAGKAKEQVRAMTMAEKLELIRRAAEDAGEKGSERREPLDIEP